MNTTRRDVLKFAGGSAVGVLFTPAPWRLITDTALWSENWPGIPAPPRGEIRTRYTNCSLCTAGCGVRARCVGDQPVELSGVDRHPLSRGALCAFGLAGHHLPFLPARVKQGPVEEAVAAVRDGIARCGRGESVVMLDLRPGRTVSWTYRRAMARVPNGRYVAPRMDGGLAVDLARARTVISLGVPLLDGWGTPGNVNAARPGFRLIQAEAVESRTASMADRYLRIRPGSEDALAQALASETGYATAAAATGLGEQQIAELARELQDNGPAVVLSASRVFGTGNAVIARRETPVPAEWRPAAEPADWAALPDGSVRVLLIDESAHGEFLPWRTVERKLVADNPVTVAFAWSRDGYARHARYVLPVSVYPEAVGDIPPAVDSVAATFRIAAPLVTPPAGMVNAEEFVARAAGLEIGDSLRERADAIHATRRGTLFTYADGKSAPVASLGAGDFWKALNAGGCWIDAPPEKPTPARYTGPAPNPAPIEDADLPMSVVLHPEILPASPILSKLYRESNLRMGVDCAALHPSCGMEAGTRVILQTVNGRAPLTVFLDAGVPPGVVAVIASPAMSDLCAESGRAKVVRA